MRYSPRHEYSFRRRSRCGRVTCSVYWLDMLRHTLDLSSSRLIRPRIRWLDHMTPVSHETFSAFFSWRVSTLLATTGVRLKDFKPQQPFLQNSGRPELPLPAQVESEFLTSHFSPELAPKTHSRATFILQSGKISLPSSATYSGRWNAAIARNHQCAALLATNGN